MSDSSYSSTYQRDYLSSSDSSDEYTDYFRNPLFSSHTFSELAYYIENGWSSRDINYNMESPMDVYLKNINEYNRDEFINILILFKRNRGLYHRTIFFKSNNITRTVMIRHLGFKPNVFDLTKCVQFMNVDCVLFLLEHHEYSNISGIIYSLKNDPLFIKRFNEEYSVEDDLIEPLKAAYERICCPLKSVFGGDISSHIMSFL